MYCSYCNGLGHKITECDKDLHLKDIIYADVEPDFRVMQHRVLKLIASLHDIKTSLPRIQIICKLRKIWRDYNSEEEQKHISHFHTLHRLDKTFLLHLPPALSLTLHRHQCTRALGFTMLMLRAISHFVRSVFQSVTCGFSSSRAFSHTTKCEEQTRDQF